MNEFSDLKKGKGFSPNSSGISSGIIFFVIVLVLAILVFAYLREDPVAIEGDFFGQKTIVANSTEVYFCPEEECASQLVSKINSANKSVFVAIYSFTSEEIFSALINAKNRGVEVRVVFDYDQSKSEYSVDEKLTENGIEIKRRDGSGYMHNKFTVIDENIVATGSFNYSNNADKKNDENLVFIVSSDLAQKFINEFNELWEQSTK